VSRAALRQLGELTDAAEQTHDFVSGVVGLAEGRMGGERQVAPSRFGRRLTSLTAVFGTRRDDVARGLATAYGPEQLRKGAVEALRMAVAVDAMRGFDDADVVWLVRRLDELEVATMSDELTTVSVRSSQLRAIHQRLSRARAAMAEARTRLVLRAARSED